MGIIIKKGTIMNEKPAKLTQNFISVMIFDHNRYCGSMDIDQDGSSLLSVFEAEDPDGVKLCVLYVMGMDYAIVISKETYDKINTFLDQGEE